MIPTIRYAWTVALVTAMVLFSARADDLDSNGDGVVRIAVLSRSVQGGGIDVPDICSDLENMVKANRSEKPVRVTFEPISKNLMLLGWWYNPDLAAERARLFAGHYDHLLLCESDDVIRDYPELFFEGARLVSDATEKNTRTSLVLVTKPEATFRDKRAGALAETLYRVADGCGLGVVPAAFGWTEALAHNRIAGNSPVKDRAYAYLVAAGIYCELTGEKVPKAALESDWTTKKTTEVLAISAYEAMRKARVMRHYSGPFSGVVRIEPHVAKRLKIYAPSTMANDPVRQNLQFILDAAFQDWFWKSPADWYRDGFDRHSVSFDLVYADTRQMDQYLDAENFSSTGIGATNRSPASVAVFIRTPEGAGKPADTLRNIESVLIDGYSYAKTKGLVFIPYQIAWARAWQLNPALVEENVPGRPNDWLTYMLANMIYTLATDRFLPVPEKAKPHVINTDHPHGYHETCARIGYDTITQLAHLNRSLNTVIMRTQTYRIETENPGFVSLRLQNRPSGEVRVFCATDVPGVAALSRESLTFAPDNFDIEQSIRILPATNSPTLFFNFMASAQSDDKAIDGATDKRPFLLNYDENQSVSFAFDREGVSPETGFRVICSPNTPPSDMVHVSVVQHGVVTEDVYFEHDRGGGRPVRLYPTAEDYRAGVLKIVLRTSSSDRRFNGRDYAFAFRVSSLGRPVPQIRVASPAENSLLDGPLFVTAKAEAVPSDGIRQTDLFLGCKRLGWAAAPSCSAAVEQGPPQSRLGVGSYVLWASATTAQGVVVASTPLAFQVRENASARGTE